MNIEILKNLTPSQIEQIEGFITHHPHGNFFQSPQAFQFFNSVDHFEPVLIVAKKNRKITGLLMTVFMENGVGLKRFFSRRCIVWGGPLINSDDTQTIPLLLLELNRIAKKKAIYIETRNLFDSSNFKKCFSEYRL